MPDIEPSRVNRNDQTLEGLRHRRRPVFALHYRPEASAGPHDRYGFFEELAAVMS